MRYLLIFGFIALIDLLLTMPFGQAQELKSQQAVAGKVNVGYAPAIAGQTKAKSPTVINPDNLPVLKYLTTLSPDGWTIAGSASDPFRIGQAVSNIISPDLLQEYRCLAQAKQILQRGQRKITIDAFQFGTADGAYGAYCASHRGSTSYAVQGDASSEDQESLSFCKNRYYICLQGSDQDDDEAKSVINNLAKQIIGCIDKEKGGENKSQTFTYNPKPAIFTAMPSFGRVLGSEKLIVGPSSLKRFFPAPYNTSLLPLQNGAVADYKLEYPHRDRLKLLIAYYPTAQAASMTYANYVSTLRDQNNEKSVEGFTWTTSLFKVSDSWLLCQLRNKQIIVINGARHKDTLSELAHQIYF